MLTPRKIPSRPMRRKPHEPAAPREDRPMAPLTPSRALVRGTYAGKSSGKAIEKSPAPARDEAYRRWVASLPCYECRIVGYSNAAHPNSGKTKGVKRDDDECFPLCVDRLSVKGCHPKFDQYELVSRADMPEYERRALEWTEQQRKAT